MTTEAIVLKFWNSWQSPTNWEEMRACLADNYSFDAGMFQANSAEEALQIAQGGNAWKDIELLDIICHEDKAAIIYEGTDTLNGARIRVSEFLTVKDNKITSGYGNVAILKD